VTGLAALEGGEAEQVERGEEKGGEKRGNEGRVSLSLWLIGTVRAEPVTVISRAWVQSPDPAE